MSSSKLYRTALTGAIGVLCIQLAIYGLNRLPDRQVPTLETAAILPGDTLLDARVIRYEAASHRTTTLSAALDSDACQLVAFFDSECPICEQIAFDWRGLRYVVIGEDTLRISWVAISPTDTGASLFMHRNNLGDDWLTLQSDEDRAALGVFGTPLLYAVGPGLVFRGRTGRIPATIDSIPDGCDSVR